MNKKIWTPGKICIFEFRSNYPFKSTYICESFWGASYLNKEPPLYIKVNAVVAQNNNPLVYIWELCNTASHLAQSKHSANSCVKADPHQQQTNQNR